MAPQNRPHVPPVIPPATKATAPKQEAKTPAPETKPEPAKSEEFSFEVGDFATGKQRPTSRVPDNIASLLEDLREAHGKEVKNAKGVAIPAGTVKFRTVTLPHKAAGDTFAKHVRSYSKTVMYPEWSARLSRLSDTSFRVGVGPVKPKQRRAKKSDTPAVTGGDAPSGDKHESLMERGAEARARAEEVMNKK